MDQVETKQGDIATALRRAAIVESDRPETIAAAHVLQLIGTVLLGAALMIGSIEISVPMGVAGAVALAVALLRSPTVPEPEVDEHFDERTGFALASALPIVVRDEQSMASLTGRAGVLVLDVNAAAARFRMGEDAAGRAVMTAIVHRLQGHAWAYPIGGSFSPLFFLEAPSTIVVVRRDLLGDQSNQWLAERLLDELSAPVPWAGGTIAPELSIGGATGPVGDGPALVTLAALARRDARAGGPGTVTIRQLDREQRTPNAPTEIVAADSGAPVGILFDAADPGSRVGIFEHLASLRTTFNRAVLALADTGSRPLIAASVTALSHPAAATDLIQRASAAGFAGRVGLVLAPDFPSTLDHRAVENVERLHQAGFLIIVDRREPIDHLKTLPLAPIDLVMVAPDFNDLGTGSPAERALLVSIDDRRAGLATPRTPVPGDVIDSRRLASLQASIPGFQATEDSLLEGAERLNQGGRVAHLAKAGVPHGR